MLDSLLHQAAHAGFSAGVVVVGLLMSVLVPAPFALWHETRLRREPPLRFARTVGVIGYVTSGAIGAPIFIAAVLLADSPPF